MANFVIKKDGSKEPFDIGKIKKAIELAAKQTDLPEDRVNELVEQVSKAALQVAEGKEEIATAELREKILSELDNLEPSVSEGWRKYDQEKGR